MTHPQFSPLGLAYHQYLRKLVTLIQAGEFVDLAELLPDHMGITSTPSFLSDKYEKQPLAVLTFKYLDKIQDLMGYQALIIEACMEYGSEAWLGYNRRFRQMAAASPGTQ